MPILPPPLDQKRLAYAMECIRLYGDRIPLEAQKAILLQRIVPGMTPYEAKLAGGGAYFKVQPDPKVWPPNANPEVVMARQSDTPDDSKIWMSFKNATQFPGEGEQAFTAYFEKGKVISITRPAGSGR